MRAAVTGATGFIGKQLCALLDRPKVLTRNPGALPSELSGLQAFQWEPLAGPPPPAAFEGVEAVFHLAGEPVAEGRWSAKKKDAIRNSRIAGTRNLIAGLAPLRDKPQVLVSASAVGFYGSRGGEMLTEKSGAAEGFLADVCRGWESEAAKAEEHGIRAASVRIGLVLGKSGGALQKIVPIFKLGAGGPLGNGRQWMPWIHAADLARLFVYVAEHETMRGPINGTAASPVTNKQFTRALAKAVRRPALFPAPAFALRLMLGEFAEVLLASQRVVPQAALENGFQFEFNELADALAAAVR